MACDIEMVMGKFPLSSLTFPITLWKRALLFSRELEEGSVTTDAFGPC